MDEEKEITKYAYDVDISCGCLIALLAFFLFVAGVLEMLIGAGWTIE